MTNHWADIGNSTCVVVWGANPAENHPACIAHVGRARFPKQFFAASDPRSLKQPAKLIVIDPRKNRTALLCDEDNGDKYVRIRPGTDIALINGLIRYIIATMEATPGAVSTGFFNHLNENSARAFHVDGSASTNGNAVTVASNTSGVGFANGNSKYTDARFLLNAGGTDYVRDRILATGAITTGAPDNTTFSDIPLKATTVSGDPNTVYMRLKAHVAPYTLAVVADICGCSTADITFIGDAYIANSKCSNGVNANGTPSVLDPRKPEYRALTMLYAMGITQHTCGAQNIKGFAMLQVLMGNMGRQGGGINALRGIHNVQGSTDMGLLKGNIPAYSNNPATQTEGGPVWSSGSPLPVSGQAFAKYMDALWGTPLKGTNTRNPMDGSYDDAYNTGAMALQQRGFYNMTLKWFGDYGTTNALPLAQKRPLVDAAYSLWPKGDGDDHVTMFRKMAPTSGTTAAIIWGQNPAVTEPNQGKVRAGLYELNLLVCVDLFETETAAVSRKAGGVTFLIPSASYVEKAGSATNSGRTLQWRYQAIPPAGNSKDDTELLLRLTKALETANAFSHIQKVWTDNGVTGSVYQNLYANPYGGYIPGTNTFAGVSGIAAKAVINPLVTSGNTTYTTGAVVTGSEWVAEKVYREMCDSMGNGCTIWIYTEAYMANDTARLHSAAASGILVGGLAGTAQPNWGTYNRAKSRDRSDGNFQLAYPGWGYSWLVNRRVLYNNSDVPGDVADTYQGADICGRLFTSKNESVLNYTSAYRVTHVLKDLPSPVQAAVTSSPHYAGGSVSMAGRFPAHTEPYETPRQELLGNSSWGRNTKDLTAGAWNLVKADTEVAGRDVAAANYPLVLTTIRCVEHFQGGPTTRNNAWNVELEPVPWIELNSADAIAKGINDGDMVRIVTARTEALPGHQLPLYGAGFQARVGVGLSTGQRVGPGVVAIPWHWGDKGLSTGSRANDLTIDALDANSAIPEYKACLCRIEKI